MSIFLVDEVTTFHAIDVCGLSLRRGAQPSQIVENGQTLLYADIMWVAACSYTLQSADRQAMDIPLLPNETTDQHIDLGERFTGTTWLESLSRLKTLMGSNFVPRAWHEGLCLWPG